MPSSQFNYMLPPTYLAANNNTASVRVTTHGYIWKDLVWTKEEAPKYSQDWWGTSAYRSLDDEYLRVTRSAARWFERTAMLQSGALPSEL